MKEINEIKLNRNQSARSKTTGLNVTGSGSTRSRFTRSRLLGMTVMCIVALPGLARDRQVSYDYGTVVDAKPIYETHRVEQPREECWTETACRQPSADNSVGTVVGGALGNTVGHSKKNKQVGVIVGAVLGGTIGRSVFINRKSQQSRPSTEQVCRTYNDYYEEERLAGFLIRHRYNDETYTTRTKRDPGDTIKLRLSVTPVT